MYLQERALETYETQLRNGSIFVSHKEVE